MFFVDNNHLYPVYLHPFVTAFVVGSHDSYASLRWLKPRCGRPLSFFMHVSTKKSRPNEQNVPVNMRTQNNPNLFLISQYPGLVVIDWLDFLK